MDVKKIGGFLKSSVRRRKSHRSSLQKLSECQEERSHVGKPEFPQQKDIRNNP